MLGALWDKIAEYLAKQPYWTAIEPFVLVGFAGVAGEMTAWEYVKATYASTTLRLFLGSYLSIRLLVATMALAGVLALFRLGARKRGASSGRVASYVRAHWRVLAYRAGVVVLAAAATAIVFIRTSPSRATRITIRVMDLPPDVKTDALTYLVYELNRPQRQWYFAIDPRPFNELWLSSAERAQCEHDDQPLLCFAEQQATADAPVVAITARPLQNVYFGTHHGLASIITTADAASYAPLTNHEYLAYMIVLQSLLVELDAHGGLPPRTLDPASASTGSALEWVPQRDMLKATILAPRLDPDLETRIFNRFGPDYLNVCSSLLSLDWLYADRTKANFDKLFGVTLSR